MDFSLLQLSGPPLLGAFIGYITNKVAIRMLFRPLRTYRFFGLKVPMTPGVIPSKRHKLAENIGEMVGEHLLTSRDISVALSREQFQNHLIQIVHDRVTDVLSRDLGPISMVVPRRFRAYFKIAVRTLKNRIRNGISLYIQSTDFFDVITETVNNRLDMFTNKELEQVINSDIRKKIYDFIDRLVLDLLNDPRTEEWLSHYLREAIQNAAQEGKRVVDLLPEPLIELILASIGDLVPEILKKVSVMVAEPQVRDRIVLALRKSIDDFIVSLGPLAAVVGSFLDAEVVERKIRNYLEDKEEELSGWLQDSEVRERLASILVGQSERLFQTSIAGLLEKVGGQRLEKICDTGALQLLIVLRSDGVLTPLSLLFREYFEELIDGGNRSLQEIFEGVLAENVGPGVRTVFIGETVEMVRSDQMEKVLGSTLNSMVDVLLAKPLGVIYDLVPAKVREGISEYIVQAANNMLLEEVPGIIDSLNIRSTVTNKIDSLDLLKLERLLLSIMEEQFKYINLFGALLGFLIGILNLLVLQFC